MIYIGMKIKEKILTFSTHGDCDIKEITAEAEDFVKESGAKEGIIVVFAPGATAAVTTMEYEPGLISDMKKFFRMLAPDEKESWRHDAGSPSGNATSHLRASLAGPSVAIPFSDGKLSLGIWQKIVFIDFDTRPRSRKVILKIIGE